MHCKTAVEISSGGNIIVAATRGIDVVARTVDHVKEVIGPNKNIENVVVANAFFPAQSFTE